MLTCPIPRPMVGTWLYGDQVDNLWTVTGVRIDPDEYTGIQQARFEAEIDNQYGAGDKVVQLVDGSSNLYATLTASPGGTGDRFTRYEADFELSASVQNYYCKTLASAAGDTLSLNFRNAIIWLDVLNAMKARFEIPMIWGDESAGGGLDNEAANNLSAYATHTRHSAYGYGGATGILSAWWTRFLLEKDQWETVDHLTLELWGALTSAAATAGKTGYAALWNFTKTLMVAGTELTFTETVPTRKTIDFDIDATNFDDGDEFEVLIYLSGGGTSSQRFYIYKSSLQPYLDESIKAQVFVPVGSVTKGSQSIPEYDTYNRFKYDADKWQSGTEFYVEATALEIGTQATLNFYDAVDFDVWIPLYALECGDVAVVSNGAIDDPGDDVLAAYEGWLEGPLGGSRPWLNFHGLEADYALATAAAYIQLNAANDTAILELSNFGFDSVLPESVVINEVYALIISTLVGPPQWVTDYVPSLGDGSALAGYIDSISKVSGVEQGSYHAATRSNKTADWGGPRYDLYYPQNAYSQPIPPDPIPLNVTTTTHTFTADRTWARANLLDGVLSVRLRVRMPSTKRFLQWCITEYKFYVSGGVDLATLNFSNVARERQRSTDVASSLVDGNRYIIHYHCAGAGEKFSGHSPVFLIGQVEGEAVPAPLRPGQEAEGVTLQPINPWIILKYSDDGGFTWSNEHWRQVGRIGEYKRRAVWNRLGMARDRVFWVEVTDPIKVVWTDAYIELEPGTE